MYLKFLLQIIKTLVLTLFLASFSLSVQASSDSLREINPCQEYEIAAENFKDYAEKHVYMDGNPALILFGLSSLGTHFDAEREGNWPADYVRLIVTWNYYASWCSRKKPNYDFFSFFSGKGHPEVNRSRSNNRATANLSAPDNSLFKLTGDSNGYLYLDFPQITISGSGCGHTYSARSKVQMGLDSQANISYQDNNWKIEGFNGIGVSSFHWTFTTNNGDNCDGSWLAKELLVDSKGSTLNTFSNTIYAQVDIYGTTYLLPIVIESIDNKVKLSLAGILEIPGLSASNASSLNIKLGSLDASKETITLNNLLIFDPKTDLSSSYNVVLSYDLSTSPISFEILSVNIN
ncbi:MAG: hypothetical protein KZQ83_09505 [gamma proteobacterium symbiont of Taylorina sp.]|nr:hypothetical protein [gamma proteobacterium symbiont of Taylorina sp.]